MNIRVLTIAALTGAMCACSPDDGGGSSLNKELTYKITSENSENLVVAVNYGIAADAISFIDLEDMASAGARSVDAHAAPSFSKDCYTGSMSGEVSYDETSASSVSASAKVDFNNCSDGETTVDGGIDFDFTMSGVDSIVSNYSFNNLSAEDGEHSVKMDGDMSVSINSEVITSSWDYYIQSSELNNQTVHSYTTTAFTLNTGDTYPTAGTWRIEGSEGTYIEATVIPNGVEVSVNGAQGEVIEWSQMGM
ncbi:MAG: hypothetical protein P8X74_11010 [Reinekea sp.]|jgi:hypothetical protein